MNHMRADYPLIWIIEKKAIALRAACEKDLKVLRKRERQAARSDYGYISRK